jgi:hypothetical protein
MPVRVTRNISALWLKESSHKYPWQYPNQMLLVLDVTLFEDAYLNALCELDKPLTHKLPKYSHRPVE